MESSVPPGFRFHPTEEELVGYYLRKKVASQKIDLDVIRDIDLYRIEPWDLQESCRIGYEEQREWYFFSHKDKKYPTGTRTNRATMIGFWKATGRDKAVYDKSSKLIGMRKTLVFYKGRAPNGLKSDWIMHEYRLESDENGPPQEEGWVICKAFKKKLTGQTKSIERWDSTYFYFDEPSRISSVMDPLDYNIIRQQQPKDLIVPENLMFKQEIAMDNNLIIDQFIQLPQLESPSLPLIRSSLMSLTEEEHKNDHDDNQNNRKKMKVTDWRALDKFVASQLSQEENRYDRADNENTSSFGAQCSSDMSALLMLQGGKDLEHEEVSKFSEFLNSDCDHGICIFD
ncbi:hypothetical protein ACFE04_003542 [Oxalis oulophora]